MKIIYSRNTGEEIQVDDEDYYNLYHFSWTVVRREYGSVINVHRKVDGRTITIQHQILGLPSNQAIDHIDSNALHNCKSNLRTCT